MNLPRLLTFSFILLTSLMGSFSYAQSSITESELDKKYTPNESSVFNNLRAKNNGPADRVTEVTFRNNIKFCPTILLRQKLFLNYEIKAYDGIAFALGFGKSFGNDYFQSLNIATQSFNSNSDLVLNPDEILLNSTFASSDFLLHGGVKIYYSGKAFDGGYMEFNYRREKIDYTLFPNINGIKIDGDNLAEFKMRAYTFGYGYSWISGNNGKVSQDFFINIGIKLFNYSKFERIETNTGSLSSSYAYTASGETANFKIIPSVNIGYSFGFGF